MISSDIITAGTGDPKDQPTKTGQPIAVPVCGGSGSWESPKKGTEDPDYKGYMAGKSVFFYIIMAQAHLYLPSGYLT
jgi:hypothetical protein